MVMEKTTAMMTLSFLLCATAFATAPGEMRRPWMIDPSAPPEDRAKLLLAHMNVTEKLHLLAGNNTMKPYVGAVTGNARLGIPPLHLNDGPQGFRGQSPFSPAGSATAWPSGLTIGASFDVDAARLWGQGMGREFAGKGSNVQLGPGVCLARIPYDGRNFEYISGEDPFLGYVMAAGAVRGIQGEGVVANAKHFAFNSQETNRSTQTANVDERTAFEMYYPPFEGAVAAGLGSVMCSYNLVNLGDQPGGARWSCENNVTLGHLKGALGFEGWVMSDWGATHSASLVEGLDQEMPGGSKMRNVLAPLVLAGNVSEAHVDAAAMRVLTPMFRVGLFDNDVTRTGDVGANVTSAAHNVLARTLAAGSMVLLKNDGAVLPIDRNTTNTIAVFGVEAQSPIVHGGGSGQVFPYYTSSPLDAIREAFGSGQPAPTVCGAQQNLTYNQADLNRTKAGSAAECCNLCLALPGCRAYTWNRGANGNCYLKSRPQQPNPSMGSVSAVMGPPACAKGEKCVVYNDGSDPDAVAADAARADISLVFIATNSGEGKDRASLDFDTDGRGDLGQNRLVEAVAAAAAAAGKPVVVVMVHPGAVLTKWRAKVQGLLAAFMPGQEYGHAVSDVLFGIVSPSARLPLTFPDTEAQYAWSQSQWPGAPAVSPRCLNWTTPGSNSNSCPSKEDPFALQANGSSTYSEKLLVGYRHFDAHSLEPAYAFGHGLSYTSFSYSNLKASATAVTVDVQNTGSLDGAEVAQLYLGFPASAGEPPKQLKGFEKVQLKAGETRTVTFPLNDRAVSVWDVKVHAWSRVSGDFSVMVGASSRDIRLTTKLSL